MSSFHTHIPFVELLGMELLKFEDGDHHMSIYPASKNDEFPACNTKPKAGETTVILMSQAIR